MSTINNAIPLVPENTTDPAAGLNQALNVLDALTQVHVLSVGTNAPPATAPAEGDRFIVGTAPTGAWEGHANKMARRLNGAYQFYDVRIAVNAGDNKLYIRPGATWIAVN